MLLNSAACIVIGFPHDNLYINIIDFLLLQEIIQQIAFVFKNIATTGITLFLFIVANCPKIFLIKLTIVKV